MEGNEFVWARDSRSIICTNDMRLPDPAPPHGRDDRHPLYRVQVYALSVQTGRATTLGAWTHHRGASDIYPWLSGLALSPAGSRAAMFLARPSHSDWTCALGVLDLASGRLQPIFFLPRKDPRYFGLSNLAWEGNRIYFVCCRPAPKGSQRRIERIWSVREDGADPAPGNRGAGR